MWWTHRLSFGPVFPVKSPVSVFKVPQHHVTKVSPGVKNLQWIILLNQLFPDFNRNSAPSWETICHSLSIVFISCIPFCLRLSCTEFYLTALIPAHPGVKGRLTADQYNTDNAFLGGKGWAVKPPWKDWGFLNLKFSSCDTNLLCVQHLPEHISMAPMGAVGMDVNAKLLLPVMPGT